MVAEIGRVCVKSSGRESGSECIVVDVVDDNFVLIDGPQVKRRRCNIKHLEPSEWKVDVKKGASTDEVEQALKEISSRASKESSKQEVTQSSEDVKKEADDRQKEPGKEAIAQREEGKKGTVGRKEAVKKSGSKG